MAPSASRLSICATNSSEVARIDLRLAGSDREALPRSRRGRPCTRQRAARGATRAEQQPARRLRRQRAPRRDSPRCRAVPSASAGSASAPLRAPHAMTPRDLSTAPSRPSAVTFARSTNFARRAATVRDELARQHCEHLVGRELHQPQQRDHAPLRIVIAGQQRALRRRAARRRSTAVPAGRTTRPRRARAARRVSSSDTQIAVAAHEVDRCFS